MWKTELLRLVFLAMPLVVVADWVRSAGKRRRAAPPRTVAETVVEHAGFIGACALLASLVPISIVGTSGRRMIGVAIALTIVRLAFGLWRRDRRAPRLPMTGRRMALLTANFIVTLALFETTAYVRVPVRQRDAVMLHFPMGGTWIVGQGGPSRLTNHHNRIPAQRYAVDLTKAGQDGRSCQSRADVARCHAWGELVMAPTDGVVMAALDGNHDNPVGRWTFLDPRGNHVVIRRADGTMVLLAHLQRGSVRVRVGDVVRTGQPLGRVGNSGRSSEPHLHLDVTRFTEKGEVGIAFCFSNVERAPACPRRNLAITAAPGATAGLPLP